METLYEGTGKRIRYDTHISFGPSGHRRVLVGRVGHSNLLGVDSEGQQRGTPSLTSPIIRVVRVGVGGPLSLARRAGDIGIGRSGLSSVAQTSSTRVRLRHARGSPGGTSTTSALESCISAETVLSVGVWLRHAVHLLGHTIVSVAVRNWDEPRRLTMFP